MKISINKNLGTLCLSIWLILTGLGVVGINVPGVIMGILALAAGVLILLGR
ncbi:MAG: hypothetical protein HY872_15790 [Chloroflexi bacterium]|nr:hypothetical protein [Chloroflexota bacterium]